MKAERAKRGERLTRNGICGPGVHLKAPGGVQGQKGKLLGFRICKRHRKALLEIFFSLNQPESGV